MSLHHTFQSLSAVVKYKKGDYHGNLIKALEYIDPNGSSDICMWTVIGVDSDKDTKCCCSHAIKNVFTIKHNITGDTMEIGSKCIKQFSNDKEVGKQVNLILRKHKNPDAKYCESCDRKVSKPIVDQFPDKKKYYHISCLKIDHNKCYECYGYEGYSCTCSVCCVDCDFILVNKASWRIRCNRCYRRFKNSTV